MRLASPIGVVLGLCVGAVPSAGGNTQFYGAGKQGDLALVEELTSASFRSAVSGKSAWAIEFYAPWCPHCQHYKQEWGKVAALAQKLSCPAKDIRVGAVNCVEEKDLCSANKITSYPSVKLFAGGKKPAPMTERDPDKLMSIMVQRWGCGADAGRQNSDASLVARSSASPAAASLPAASPSAPPPTPKQHGSTAPAGADPTAHAERELDLAEAVWFSLEQTIFAGRRTLNPDDGIALVHWLTVLGNLLPHSVLALGQEEKYRPCVILKNCGHRATTKMRTYCANRHTHELDVLIMR